MTTNSSLLIISAHGIYIPQFFAESYTGYITNLDKVSEDLKDLNSPDNENYWEAWESVLDNAELKDDENRECVLLCSEDGDLWAVPVSELDEIEQD